MLVSYRPLAAPTRGACFTPSANAAINKKARGSAFVPLHDLLNVAACNIAHFGSSRAVKQAATPRSEQRADAALAI